MLRGDEGYIGIKKLEGGWEGARRQMEDIYIIKREDMQLVDVMGKEAIIRAE